MIQLNLLPSIKLEFIKATRTKRLVTSLAVITSLVALSVMALLLVNVNVVQKRHISNLTTDIEKKVGELEAVPDIDKVLTVQNQLSVLKGLHEKKPAVERVLPYLSKLTPQAASISDTSINFTESSASIKGTADTLATINKFVDTLKFTNYRIEQGEQQKPAFSSVVLTSFSVSEKGVSYQMDFKFDPTIFDNTKEVELVIPNIISTRSQTEKPSDLFQAEDNNQIGQ